MAGIFNPSVWGPADWCFVMFVLAQCLLFALNLAWKGFGLIAWAFSGAFRFGKGPSRNDEERDND